MRRQKRGRGAERLWAPFYEGQGLIALTCLATYSEIVSRKSASCASFEAEAPLGFAAAQTDFCAACAVRGSPFFESLSAIAGRPRVPFQRTRRGERLANKAGVL